MSLADIVKPKDTEEIKPGLFIQKKGEDYRQVYPASWNGKINWSNFIFGGKPISSTVFFILILFLVWSYNHDIKEYRDFYLEIHEDPFELCSDLMNSKSNGFNNLLEEVNLEKRKDENTNSISSNS